MRLYEDLFDQINNAVLDLQSAQYQTFQRPLKVLSNLLHSPEFEEINRTLLDGIDFDAFIDASEKSGGSMVGSHQLVWPEDQKSALGLTLVLIDKLASSPGYAINFSHHYFYTRNNHNANLNALTRQLIIPFARDYKSYVLSLSINRSNAASIASNKVFVVHGHDDAALQGLARFIEKLGLEVIILKEQPDQGRTIIEKFEKSANDVGFAVVLLTPDDVGSVVAADTKNARARQNVIFELGYFSGKLGRGRVCLLRKGNVEIPSDLFGVIYTEMDPAEGWQRKLVGELKAAKLDFDANRMWS